MQLNRFFWLSFLFLAGCTTSPPAPVIDRAPAEKKPAQTRPAEKPATLPAKPSPGVEKDWRPDTYTVKKGDTLYGIGLQYGFDYREIAQANNIAPPYPIQIGQQLNFQSLKANGSKPAPAPAAASEDGVVITPLKTDSMPAPQAAAPAQAVSGEPPLLSEPKALREPYSELALAAPAAKPGIEKPAEQSKVPEATKPAGAAPQPEAAKASTPADEDAVDWGWPANGKIIAGFNEGNGTRGIDIGGSLGQPVNAAATGKVIYSGSDLRGYGKLIIIKHNKTYLSVYAHNSQILVKEGQQVAKGQKIAEMGSTDADRIKLHFEIRKQGKSVDPGQYLPGSP